MITILLQILIYGKYKKSPMISFRILKKSARSGARVGVLSTPHGEVETPAFVGVATQAGIKTLTAGEAALAGSGMLICNTYHLHLRPGAEVVKRHGGLHSFMNWQRPLMTDSGGFQVFSLGWGRELGIGKIAMGEGARRGIHRQSKPKFLKITEDGVFFRSHIDGREFFLGPSESVALQEALGADIMFAFDECPPPGASTAYLISSLKKTHRWAEACLDAKKSDQALYGIVQGGASKSLREESARFIGGLPFNGFGIGGEFGSDKKEMIDMLSWTLQNMSEEKPRHLLGIGRLEDIMPILKAGIDTFDCIVPTHYARRGIAFTSEGKLNMRSSLFLDDEAPLDKACACSTCVSHSRAYISHMFRAGELLPLRLLTFHNLYYVNAIVAKIRQDILNGKV